MTNVGLSAARAGRDARGNHAIPARASGTASGRRASAGGAPLFDLGAPACTTTPPSLSEARAEIIRAQGGRCANDQCRRAPKSLDVVRTSEGVLVAFCRSCRLRWDAPARVAKARVAKARATRALGVQLQLSGVGRRARSRVVLPNARDLVEEAMRSLPVSTDAPSATSSTSMPELGAWAVIATLRRCGFAFAEEEKENDHGT